LDFPPHQEGAIGIGETIETGNDVVNFGFVCGDIFSLGGEALLNEAFDAGFVYG
jgi:hypothetical protein